jgi:hypothetical protein
MLIHLARLSAGSRVCVTSYVTMVALALMHYADSHVCRVDKYPRHYFDNQSHPCSPARVSSSEFGLKAIGSDMHS